MPLTGRGEPLQVPALEVSPNFFATLGVSPARGRAFLAGGAASDDERSAIVSDRLWRTSLEADPAIVGQSITIDGLSRTVVGVLPPDFSFRPVIRAGALPEADIILPNRWAGDTGGSAFLFLLGRMAPGVTQERAEAELTALVNDSSVVPAGALGMEGAPAPNVHRLAHAVGLQTYGSESVRTLLLILLGAVSLVLLIACVNVANLQIARLTARRGELSVRMALGAGRRRILRQLLTEAVVLALVGASLGVVLAQIAIHVTLPLVPPFVLPRLGGIVIDARVLAFCLGLSFVSTLLIGLVPALRVSGAAFGEGLALHAGETRTTSDRQGEQLRTLLVAGQIAVTLVLLIAAGLLIHSFVRLTSVSPGFESSGRDGVVQTVKVTLPERLYDEPERIHAFARGVLDRIQYLPGVTSASLVNSAPFGRMFIRDEFGIEGQPKPTLDMLNGGPMGATAPRSSTTVPRLTTVSPLMYQTWVSPVDPLYQRRSASLMTVLLAPIPSRPTTGLARAAIEPRGSRVSWGTMPPREARVNRASRLVIGGSGRGVSQSSHRPRGRMKLANT